MTTVTLTSSESRHSKALALLADRAFWSSGMARDGRPVVAMPSQRTRGLFHLTDGTACSCQDFQRRQQACKHVLAFRLAEIARHTQQPASDVVAGLQEMARPQFVAIHTDAQGNTVFLPRRVAAEDDERARALWHRFETD